MAKKTINKELTGAQDLYNFLFEACNIIRGPVSQDNFKDYITPLLYYKRISDVYDEETEEALISSGGDKEYASLPEQHRFVIPDGCHWQEVRERTENLGAAIVGAMRQIEIANPDTLYGVLSMFSSQKWTNKAILNDSKIRDLIEHLSKRKLGNKDYPADLMGTNRKYNVDKKCGLIVDFVGVFDNVAKSLAFDEETVKTVVKNIDEIKVLIPQFLQECIDFFPGVDRTIGGWEGLQAAQQCLLDESTKTNFAKHFSRLAKAWETVSPDAMLAAYQADYTWLAQVYQSVRPVSTGGSLIWTLLGAKTIEIIHRNIDTIDIGTPLEDLVVDGDVIDMVLEQAKDNPKKILEVEKMLRLRLGEHHGDPNYKAFAEKLDELRRHMEENLITSIDFLRGLLTLAKEVLEEEKNSNQPLDKREQAKAALTELFESIRTEDTPIIVERVVADIDENVVAIVRKFKDAFKSITAQREIKKKLRSILWVNYQIKDQEVFDKAYQYIEMYY